MWPHKPPQGLSALPAFLEEQLLLSQHYSFKYGVYLTDRHGTTIEGLVFVHYGLYQGCRVPFIIDWKGPAQVTFTQSIYHPMVHPLSGALDMHPLHSQNKNHPLPLQPCVLFIFNVFHDLAYLQYNSLNPSAMELFKVDVERFAESVRSGVYREEGEEGEGVEEEEWVEQVRQVRQSGLPEEQQKALLLDSLLQS